MGQSRYATIDRRSVLHLMVAASTTMLSQRRALATAPDQLRVQRLAWAGIRLQLAGGTLFIDPLTDRGVWGLALKDRLVPVNDGVGDRFVLITHRHPDHADPVAIREALGDEGTLIFPNGGGVPHVAGVRARAAGLYEPQLLGDFTATAVPASDGYGDPQVSWVVSAGGRRILHAGDTLWHGSWWHIGRQYGPFDAAFLPINGARFRWRQPASEIPAVLTPEQAVAAALVLDAKLIVPIHYGVKDAEGYAEVAEPVAALRVAAGRRRVPVAVLSPGDWLDWPDGR